MLMVCCATEKGQFSPIWTTRNPVEGNMTINFHPIAQVSVWIESVTTAPTMYVIPASPRDAVCDGELTVWCDKGHDYGRENHRRQLPDSWVEDNSL